MTWNKIAHYVDKTHNAYVDWEEEFFECPECGVSQSINVIGNRLSF